MKKALIMHKGSLAVQTAQGHYVSIAKKLGLTNKSTISLKGLYYDSIGKTPAAVKREWLESVQDELKEYDYIIITDSDYFKVITKQTKADTTIGILQTSEYFPAKVLYMPPVFQAKFDLGKFNTKVESTFQAVLADITGSYIEIGSDIIHSEHYPMTTEEIKKALNQLHQYPELSMDIEAKSLKVTEAGIYTIGFAWDKHNGIAFPVDSSSEPEKVRKLLKEFLLNYKGKLVVHKANYDISVIVYTLFMEENFTNLKEQVVGIKHLCRNLDDTLLITYLASNSCSGNTLGLKELAQPFAGDWAVDVTDVTKVDLKELLRYNLIDCLSTHYVKEKYYPVMVADNQEELYKKHFLPYLQDCIRMQLNGLPVNPDKVLELEKELIKEKEDILSKIQNTAAVINAEIQNAHVKAEALNRKYKKKRVTWNDVREPFNFNSNKQLEILLYEVMALPVIETTPSGNPSTASGTLEALANHTDNPQYKEILKNISLLNDVEKILSGFIPAFKTATTDKYGNVRLCGYFNLGGTVSGRMSSNNPNLQNLPATGSRFAKPVKRVFTSSPEWIMCGIDFSSLEDRIDALKTKDTQKLKVYLDGYDGHCLRAYAYFGDQMPDIEDTVESINSIASKYKKLRQSSKSPSFALTYGGTYLTLMKNCGFSEELAKQIEERYHKLYAESDKWVHDKIKQACIDGYVTGAFGLRVRTPMLYRANPYKLTNIQAAESRTAGNALGQGWGLLNNRAMNAVLKRIDEAGLTEGIYPIAAIHDACYYMVRNNPETVLWLNQVTTEEAKWQDNPVISHPQVGLEGQLDLFFPDWATPLTLPESLTEPELIDLVQKHMEKLNE